MLAPGLGEAAHQGEGRLVADEPTLDLETGAGGLSAVLVDAHRDAHLDVPSLRGIDAERVRRSSLDDGQVLLVDLAGLEGAHQRPRRLGATAAHQQPGGLAVEPVRRVGAEPRPVLALEQLHQRVVVVPRGGGGWADPPACRARAGAYQVQLDDVLGDLGLGLGAPAQGEGQPRVDTGARLQWPVRDQAALEDALHPGPATAGESSRRDSGPAASRRSPTRRRRSRRRSRAPAEEEGVHPDRSCLAGPGVRFNRVPRSARVVVTGRGTGRRTTPARWSRDPVGQLAEPMPLVREEDVLHRDPALVEGGHHLLRLDHRDIRRRPHAGPASGSGCAPACGWATAAQQLELGLRVAVLDGGDQRDRGLVSRKKVSKFTIPKRSAPAANSPGTR